MFYAINSSPFLITKYIVSCYANDGFGELPIVSSAFLRSTATEDYVFETQNNILRNNSGFRNRVSKIFLRNVHA